jgi:hypothetical protein
VEVHGGYRPSEKRSGEVAIDRTRNAEETAAQNALGFSQMVDANTERS